MPKVVTKSRNHEIDQLAIFEILRKNIVDRVYGVMVSVLNLSAGRSCMGSGPDRVKPKTSKLVFVAFSF